MPISTLSHSEPRINNPFLQLPQDEPGLHIRSCPVLIILIFIYLVFLRCHVNRWPFHHFCLFFKGTTDGLPPEKNIVKSVKKTPSHCRIERHDVGDGQLWAFDLVGQRPSAQSQGSPWCVLMCFWGWWRDGSRLGIAGSTVSTAVSSRVWDDCCAYLGMKTPSMPVRQGNFLGWFVGILFDPKTVYISKS